MKALIISLAFSLSFATFGETLIIPQGAETRENVHNIGHPFSIPGDVRSQQIYSGSLFPSVEIGKVFQLDGLAFRLGSQGTIPFSSSASFDRVEIVMSFRSGPFTLDLDQNHGANPITVFDAPLSLAGDVPTGTFPSDFDLQIVFTEPFFFDPRSGSLVVEIRKFGGSQELSSLAASEVAGTTFFYEGDFGAGTFGNIGLDTKLSYEVVPEPSVFSLILFGLFLIPSLKARLTKRKRKRGQSIVWFGP